MTPPALRRARGFTLVELLVSVAISAILLVAIFGVVQSQQTAYFEGHLQRAAQGSARSALTFIEQRLALAGYGMDAPLAFDFTRYGIDAAYPAPCPALAAPCPRDSIGGNDELVFYARNPRYWVPDDRTGIVEPRGKAWRVTGIAGNTLTLSARKDDVFEKGRVLQVVCKDGAKYAYMTVAQNVGPLANDVAGLAIGLASAAAADPFRRQDTTSPAVDGCFTSGSARAFQIDRFRFHVRPVGTAAGATPYLVLDTGLDLNNDGPDEAEEIVLAEGIESFQVGYVMTNAALTPRGTVADTPIAFAPGTTGLTAGDGMTTLQFPGLVPPGQSEYQPTSWYRYAVGPTPSISDERLTDHQANIRGVRITIVARGSQPDPGAAHAETLTPILNQTAMPAWAQANVPFNRARVETTVLVRNMTSRGMNDF